MSETETKEKPAAITEEIRRYQEKISFMEGLPEEVDTYVFSIYWGWEGNLHLNTVGDTDEEQAKSARLLLGAFIKQGWSNEIVKKTQVDEDDDMHVICKLKGMKWGVRIDNYMAKTCRIVEEEVTLPAEPEKVTPAKPARTIKRKVIQCDGMESKVLSEEEVIN